MICCLTYANLKTTANTRFSKFQLTISTISCVIYYIFAFTSKTLLHAIIACNLEDITTCICVSKGKKISKIVNTYCKENCAYATTPTMRRRHTLRPISRRTALTTSHTYHMTTQYSIAINRKRIFFLPAIMPAVLWDKM